MATQHSTEGDTDNFLSFKELLSLVDKNTIWRLLLNQKPKKELPALCRVTAANPNPPLMRYAIPIGGKSLVNYGIKCGCLAKGQKLQLGHFEQIVEALSREIGFALELVRVWDVKSESSPSALGLCTNKTMEKKPKSEKDLMEKIQTALAFEVAPDPLWYPLDDEPSDDEAE